MADLSVEDVRAILADQGLAGIAEEELVETTQRVNALMRGLERLEATGTVDWTRQVGTTGSDADHGIDASTPRGGGA